MASHVQVVLREDVDSLGKAGELVRVRPGYARNYLLPRQLAKVATQGNIEQIEHERRSAVARAAKLRKNAEGIAAALAEVTIVVAKQAGEAGRLFGSVTAADVARELQSKGYEVDRKKIQMPDGIKELGTYDVSVKLGTSIQGTFKLEVVAAE